MNIQPPNSITSIDKANHDETIMICPGCGSSSATKQFPLVHSSMWSCHDCGVSYVHPRASTEAMLNKLQLWAEQDVVDKDRLQQSFSPENLSYYRRFLDWMTPFANTGDQTLLDIGCSTGAFLSVSSEAGWQSSGIEIGKASATYASNTLGLQVTQGSLYDWQGEPESYDAVSLIEVIEHLESPGEALEQAYRLLKPGGVILVTTPNFNSLYRRLFGNRWWVVNCEDEHIVLFTIDSLKKLLVAHGFEVKFQRICGIDLLGITRSALGRFRGQKNTPINEETAATEYYQGRSRKQTVKQLLSKLGLLKVVKSILKLFDTLFSLRWSPFFQWGEQLVVIATKPTAPKSAP
jgi:2-polyprenyl-3-methyl-5-hydroxy-6-metoxy-1,4-benzoquinol methylase